MSESPETQKLSPETDNDLHAVNQMLRAQIVSLNRKVVSLASEAARAREAQAAADARLRGVHNTLSYRLGHLLIHTFKSKKNFKALPRELWRLRADARARRQGKRTHFPLSNANQGMPLFLGTATPLSDEGNQRRPFVPLRNLPADLKTLKVACILDTFSMECLKPECELLPLTPTHWQEELESFKPHFVLVESAWDGNGGAWNRKVAPVSPELLQMLEWCHEQGITTAFWNKEDPVHFETFIDVAKHFDAIFTTEVSCIPLYKQRLGHSQVFLLPFACQPRVHNPLELAPRKSGFCFAGSYYARFPERQQDLGLFTSTLSGMGRVVIYDRNSHPGNPDYSFPAEYQPFIAGTLSPQDIHIAYKGYTFGINMNSIKQSMSMFARRVFELMASNTLVVSNYSHGLKVLFGDLVVATDGAEELQKQVSELLASEHKRQCIREAALRKVLSEHTYAMRLKTVVEALSQQTLPVQKPHILVAAMANTSEELSRILKAFESQTYAHRFLVVVCHQGVTTTAGLSEKVRLISHQDAQSCTLRDQSSNCSYVAAFDANDHYGPNYLLDFALATAYVSADALGKTAHYEHLPEGETTLRNSARMHTKVTLLHARAACIPATWLADETVASFCTSIPTRTFGGENLTSVGAFGYCRNAHTFNMSFSHADFCNGEAQLDTGVPLSSISAWLNAPQVTQLPSASNALRLGGSKLHGLFAECSSDGLAVRNTIAGICVESSLPKGTHQYLYASRDIELCPGQEFTDFSFSTTAGLNLSFTLFFISSNQQKLASTHIHAGRLSNITPPPATQRVRLALRVEGGGSTTLTEIKTNSAGTSAFAVCATSPYLLLTNRYPSSTDLYKNAFVHRRVVQYQKYGVRPDVFQFRPNLQPGYHEFEGVPVTTGGTQELETLLTTHPYKAVLIHFLEPDMWDSVKKLLPHTKVIIWCHGAEIQHWKRRACNYPTPELQAKAELEWLKKYEFWHRVFAQRKNNLTLVFVSKTLANEVMEDYGIALDEDDFRIIPNFVDTELFRFEKKDTELRKRILTIRPFTAPNYACDLAVKTILEISKRPFFPELKFTIVGDGPLFEETVAPLRAYTNVELRKGFVTQPEIARLHKEHGVFLCPTRADTQGVSRDEAMASGLIPITNSVGAVPEFVDQFCGFLAPENDIAAMEQSLGTLYKNPEEFTNISSAASLRVMQTLDKKETVGKEMALLSDQPFHLQHKEARP